MDIILKHYVLVFVCNIILLYGSIGLLGNHDLFVLGAIGAGTSMVYVVTIGIVKIKSKYILESITSFLLVFLVFSLCFILFKAAHLFELSIYFCVVQLLLLILLRCSVDVNDRTLVLYENE
jgi:hypothetical protein